MTRKIFAYNVWPGGVAAGYAVAFEIRIIIIAARVRRLKAGNPARRRLDDIIIIKELHAATRLRGEPVKSGISCAFD